MTLRWCVTEQEKGMGGAASLAADRVVATVGSVKALPPYMEGEVKALMLKARPRPACMCPASPMLPVLRITCISCCLPRSWRPHPCCTIATFQAGSFTLATCM
jgi:hypothetical protein